MNKFAKNFMLSLNEAIEEASLQQDLEQEKGAVANVLDDGTDPSEFDLDMTQSPEEQQATDEVADAMSRRNEQIVNELQGWIDTVEEFLEFLNSEDPNSVQSRLASATPDTIMDKMKQSQQTKISRVAADLASLHQNFLGFMAQTSNAKFRYVSWAIFGGLSFLSMGGLNHFC